MKPKADSPPAGRALPRSYPVGLLIISLLPVVLALLLLAAHFLRAGHPTLIASCVSLPTLLFLRERWVPVLFQALLAFGALEWLRTLYLFAAVRIAAGEPWGRLAAILVTVALLTAASALVFRLPAPRWWFRPTPGDAASRAG